MFPDKTPFQAPSPASLPQMPAQSLPQVAAAQPLPPEQLAEPVALPQTNLAAVVERVQQLIDQYGTNPYAFNAAFQQLKAQYLRDQYHIDPSMEKR